MPRPSIQAVADLAGCSAATVSRALHGDPTLVAPATRERILEAAATLNYRPNVIGRALRTNRTGVVALLISDIHNSFYSAVTLEIEKRMNSIGALMLLGNTDEDPALQDRYLQELQSINISAVMILSAVDSPLLATVVQERPVVFINRMARGVTGGSFVGIDDYKAARELAGAIARSATGPIGVVHGPMYSVASENRLRGITEALAELGLPISPDRQIESNLSMEGGYRSFGLLWQRHRNLGAIFCGNDQIAYGVHRRCQELDLRVPEDIRLYGFDDNPMNEWLAPWLNTVRVPHMAYAVETVKQVRRLWAGEPPATLLLPYMLVIRN